MSAKIPSLADLRRDIDQIDDDMHDLLMRRTDLVRSIAAAKGDNAVYVRPGREAQILRRLIERHDGAFPKPVLVRIWREIVSAFAALQGPLALAVSVPEQGPDLRKLAHDHYGSLSPVTAYESAMGVLRAVIDGQATVGVLPRPRGDEEDPWWRYLARDGALVPRIVARLPFAEAIDGQSDEAEGLAVALSPQEESGLDRSFLVLDSPESMSRGTLRSSLTESGLDVFSMQGWTEMAGRRLHLVEVEGYLVADDARLRALIDDGADSLHQCWVIGGYAVPLAAEQLAVEPAEESG